MLLCVGEQALNLFLGGFLFGLPCLALPPQAYSPLQQKSRASLFALVFVVCLVLVAGLFLGCCSLFGLLFVGLLNSNDLNSKPYDAFWQEKQTVIWSGS